MFVRVCVWLVPICKTPDREQFLCPYKEISRDFGPGRFRCLIYLY